MMSGIIPSSRLFRVVDSSRVKFKVITAVSDEMNA